MSEFNAYVYAVVGKGKHSARVDRSVQLLQSLTKLEIYVVVGKHRHNVSVKAKMIEADVPGELDDHEASIWLKTALNKFLPTGKIYAYLDSDILSLHDPDGLFDQFNSPIMFARDHATLDQFSPYAVTCGCLKDKLEQQLELQEQIDQFANYSRSELPKEILLDKQSRLEILLSDKMLVQKWLRFVKFNLAGNRYHISKEFYFDKVKNAWFDNDGAIILYHEPNQHIQRHSPYTHNDETGQWFNTKQEDIHDVQCSHMRELIHNDFDIDADGQELLWNGGLFLFDDHSEAFMNTWHQIINTMLSNDKWQTRDQAALYITFRKFNLDASKNQLEKKWNWLITEDRDLHQLLAEKTLPHFIHLMHPMIDDQDGVNDLHHKLMRLE